MGILPYSESSSYIVQESNKPCWTLCQVAGNSPEENAVEMRELLKGGWGTIARTSQDVPTLILFPAFSGSQLLKDVESNAKPPLQVPFQIL